MSSVAQNSDSIGLLLPENFYHGSPNRRKIWYAASGKFAQVTAARAHAVTGSSYTETIHGSPKHTDLAERPAGYRPEKMLWGRVWHLSFHSYILGA